MWRSVGATERTNRKSQLHLVDVTQADSEARFPLVGGQCEIAVLLRDGEYSNAAITTRRRGREVNFRL